MDDFEELSTVFRTEAHERLDEIIEALRAQQPALCDNNNLERTRRAAHNLKGAALTVGARPVAGLCGVLEDEIQGLVALGQSPNSEQIATWQYIATEIQGIVDDPNIVHLRLDGDLALPPGIGNELRGGPLGNAGAISNNSTANASAGSIDELTRQVQQLAQLQARLSEGLQDLEALCSGEAGAVSEEPSDYVLKPQLRSRLAPLHQGVGNLGVLVAGLMNSVEAQRAL